MRIALLFALLAVSGCSLVDSDPAPGTYRADLSGYFSARSSGRVSASEQVEFVPGSGRAEVTITFQPQSSADFEMELTVSGPYRPEQSRSGLPEGTIGVTRALPNATHIARIRVRGEQLNFDARDGTLELRHTPTGFEGDLNIRYAIGTRRGDLSSRFSVVTEDAAP